MNDTDAQLLTRYFDGECTTAEQSMVEQLLRDDPAATEWLEKWTSQQKNWRELPPLLSEETVTADWQKLQERLLTAEPEPERPRVINWMAWSHYWTLAAAAAVFILASIVFLLPRSEIVSAKTPYNVVDRVDTDLNATPIVYVDKVSGWSIVWVDESTAG